ncbi:MAG: hypothetical protein K2Y37_06350 [Pirellulales bacterium]|nr:hypothetical protein [Pirellulales bacterium]
MRRDNRREFASLVFGTVPLVENRTMRQNSPPSRRCDLRQAMVRGLQAANDSVTEDQAMRGILFLVVGVVGLIAAGVLTVKFNGSGASVEFNKDKARERAGQLANEVKVIEQSLEQSAQAKK